MESDSTRGGDTILDPVLTPIGNVAQQTCYDLRFSELSIAQRHRGADILTFPSAFTVKTGQAHWEYVAIFNDSKELYYLVEHQ